MPKNKGKGGKNRRRGKNENESEKRELIFKEDEQEYAQVTKMLGNGRLEAMCFDGVKRLCHIRGKLRKKVSVFRLVTKLKISERIIQVKSAYTIFIREKKESGKIEWPHDRISTICIKMAPFEKIPTNKKSVVKLFANFFP